MGGLFRQVGGGGLSCEHVPGLVWLACWNPPGCIRTFTQPLVFIMKGKCSYWGDETRSNIRHLICGLLDVEASPGGCLAKPFSSSPDRLTVGRLGLAAFVCFRGKCQVQLCILEIIFSSLLFFKDCELKYNRGEFKAARRIFPAVSGLSLSSKPSNR